MAQQQRLTRLSDSFAGAVAWLGRFMGTPAFIWWTIGFYILCGVIFSITIHWGTLSVNSSGNEIVSSNFIVPDEDRHTSAILYYADRGWWQGPVINHLDPKFLVEGELQREPSFLYYWVMSIVVSAFRLITTDYNAAVILLRIINVLVGALGLYVVWRTLLMVKIGPRTAALSVLALSLTGRYLWQGAGITYDMPSLVLYFGFVYFAVALLSRGGVQNLLFASVCAVMVSITKYTYLPFVGVALIALVVIYVRRIRHREVVPFRENVRQQFRDHRVRSLSGLVLLLAGAGLFVERIGGNLLRYRAVEPNCADVHGATACNAFLIYRRNVTAKQHYLDLLAQGQPPVKYDPFTFTGDWLDRYYRSLFYYLPRTSPLTVPNVTFALIAIVAIAILIFVAVNRTPVLRTLSGWFIAVLSAAYLFGTYFFNLHTYLTLNQHYAFSGRYLLPIVPFAYAAIIRIVVTNWRRVPGLWRPIIGIPLVLATIAVAVLNTSLVAFITFGRGAGWYEPWVAEVAKSLFGIGTGSG